MASSPAAHAFGAGATPYGGRASPPPVDRGATGGFTADRDSRTSRTRRISAIVVRQRAGGGSRLVARRGLSTGRDYDNGRRAPRPTRIAAYCQLARSFSARGEMRLT